MYSERWTYPDGSVENNKCSRQKRKGDTKEAMDRATAWARVVRLCL